MGPGASVLGMLGTIADMWSPDDWSILDIGQISGVIADTDRRNDLGG